MNRSFLSFLFLWTGLSLPLSRAAAPNEQAEAFFARGLAAEQRGDFIVADHCLELTLRANPGHAQAQTKLKELEARQDTWTEEKARKVVLNHFKVDIWEGQHPPIRESNLRRMWDEITRESGIPVIFENDGQDVGRINFDLKNVAVAEVLEQIAEQTRFDLTYELRAIRFSPKAIELTDETAKANSRRMVRFEGVVKRIDGNNGDHIWIRFEGAETYLFSGAEHYRQVFGPSDQEFPIKPGQRLRARGRIILDKGIPYIRLAAASQWEIIASDDALANPSLLKPADASPAPKPSLTSVAPFAPDSPATTSPMPQKEAVPSAGSATKAPPSASGQPDPKTDFKGWLKTVQLVHVTGNKFTINDDEVLQLNPSGSLNHFRPFTIDPENRIVTWDRPEFTAKLTVAEDLKSFQYAHKTSETDVKGNRVEPRDPAIFDGKPVVQPLPVPDLKPAEKKSDAAKAGSATPAKSLENSLGMKFLPVIGSKVLFCIHETRRQDYAAFAAAMPKTDGTWKTAKRNEIPCGHLDDHPVVGVSRDDARSFCVWLSQKEGKTYRLPSDEEWSLAVGVAAFESRTSESTPELLNMKEETRFPWGENYPPKSGEPVGNYADSTWLEVFPTEGVVAGYSDGFVTTAPVMNFPANSFGLFDLGGNVWEWINDPWQGAALGGPAMRGAAFSSSGQGALLSSRRTRAGNPRPPDAGFRIVLEVK